MLVSVANILCYGLKVCFKTNKKGGVFDNKLTCRCKLLESDDIVVSYTEYYNSHIPDV